jgi:hypothetical protein
MKYSIYLDRDAVMMMNHIRFKGESMSSFIQRLIFETGRSRGLEVVTIVRQTDESDTSTW